MKMQLNGNALYNLNNYEETIECINGAISTSVEAFISKGIALYNLIHLLILNLLIHGLIKAIQCQNDAKSIDARINKGITFIQFRINMMYAIKYYNCSQIKKGIVLHNLNQYEEVMY
ncbi:unnamed protein product [Paramecium octaurelia]|uniref:Uncharacterized protein n=1 Tax=Paramecium octaurelia TaxID=43137 RepID=A0A8S1SJ88_PAROT|nr:unnamed protein product [Paramecium octaurelia]